MGSVQDETGAGVFLRSPGAGHEGREAMTGIAAGLTEGCELGAVRVLMAIGAELVGPAQAHARRPDLGDRGADVALATFDLAMRSDEGPDLLVSGDIEGARPKGRDPVASFAVDGLPRARRGPCVSVGMTPVTPVEAWMGELLPLLLPVAARTFDVAVRSPQRIAGGVVVETLAVDAVKVFLDVAARAIRPEAALVDILVASAALAMG